MAVRDEGERLGQLLRAIRRRAGLTQAELALAAKVPRTDVIAVEAGKAGEIALDRLRRILAAADGARLNVTAWWRGAAADRLLDERHAAIVERAMVVYVRWSWQAAVEVTYSE